MEACRPMTKYHIIETEWGDVRVDAEWYDAIERAAIDKVYPPQMDRSLFTTGIGWVRDNVEFEIFKMVRLFAKRVKDAGDDISTLSWPLGVP